jgi:hypothetical protein
MSAIVTFPGAVISIPIGFPASVWCPITTDRMLVSSRNLSRSNRRPFIWPQPIDTELSKLSPELRLPGWRPI